MVDNCWFEAKNINCIKNGFRVIKDLNLKLNFGENVIMLGPNGSGKSSIVDLINRNIYPLAGNNASLKIFNKELINLWEIRKKISTVNSEIKKRINPNIKVLDLIISGLYGKYCLISNYRERDVTIAENLIREINIERLSKKNFSNLSDGEKQIALIARALIIKPQILILDEPVSNLDYNSKFFVIDKINELSKLKTNIFCITHDITMISKIYNRILMIKNRVIINDGVQSEVINRENINKLYEIDVQLTDMKEIGL